MAGTLILLMGNSKAGKSSLAERLGESYIKFASPVKRAVESALGLGSHSIDFDEETKAKAMPLLIEAFEKTKWVQENLWIPAVINLVKMDLNLNYSVVIDDLRKPAEAEAIIKLLMETGANLVLVYIHRESEEVLETDKYLHKNMARLTQHAKLFYEFDNNYDIEDLNKKAAMLNYAIHGM